MTRSPHVENRQAGHIEDYARRTAKNVEFARSGRTGKAARWAGVARGRGSVLAGVVEQSEKSGKNLDHLADAIMNDV